MRMLTKNELAAVSGGLYESVDSNCALAAGAMIVSVFGGPVAAIAAGMTAIGACTSSSSAASSGA